MDRLFWKADWQESSDPELFAKVAEVTCQPRWVLDGNYTRTRPISWRQVQLVVWIAPAFLDNLFRVTATAHRCARRSSRASRSSA